MIITDQRSEVTSTIEGESSEFRIATNSKAFRVLVDGIYADKIGSIVRELLSNAYDAHARAGTLKVPFEVRLPNFLSPVFSVRDYGCSMPHDFVMQTYSTLFESSKGATNEEVGSFGLGAKSFLAYTDACTLTCWSDGERRSYALAINASGVPEVRLVHRAPSTDPTGVEVQFAVNPDDFLAFNKAATVSAYGFDIMPRFLGQDVSPEVPLFKGEGWRWYGRRIMSDAIVVRQGCAVYPTNQWKFNPRSWSLPMEGTLIVDRPIGTVNVTASRESLAMTTTQEDGLRLAIRAAAEALTERVRDRYRGLSTEIARARFAYENRDLMGSGDWPTSVKTPWPMLKFDQGALVPYDSFHVSTLDKVLVVHDDGLPVLRRILRLRALARSGKSVYIESSLEKVQLAQSLLGLRPHQVIKIADIPDVTITRLRSSSVGRQKKELSLDSVWVSCNHNKVVAGELRWVRNTESIAQCISKSTGRSIGLAQVEWIESVIRQESLDRPLLFLTDAEVRRGLENDKIGNRQRLDIVLQRHLSDQAIVTLMGEVLLHKTLKSALSSGSSVVQAAMLERLGAGTDTPHCPLGGLFQVLLPKPFQALEVEAATRVAELAERFPLLFRFDSDSALDYIALCEKNLALTIGQ